MGLFSSLGSLAGSAAGSLIPIPGVGTALGGLGGLLDGSGRGGAEAPADHRSALAQRFAQMATGPATATATYAAGRRELDDQARRDTSADRARLAAAGGLGGEAEVAMASARGQARSSALTRLLGVAGERQLSAGRLALSDFAQQQARDDQRSANRNALIGGAFQTVATVLPHLLKK